MNIDLDNNYKITSDSLNVMLQERKIAEKGKEAGKEYWQTVGYYSNVQDCLERYLHENINKSDATSILELINRINEAEEVIKKVKVK